MVMYLCIDIGGTQILSLLADREGRIGLVFPEIPTPGDKENFLREIFKRIEEAGPVRRVAISTTGIIDMKTGQYISSGKFDFLPGLNLKEMIEENFGLITAVVNDGVAGLYCETWKGRLRGVNNGVLLTLGTNLGGGIVIGGSPYYGARRLSAEFSYLRYFQGDNRSIGDDFSAVNFIQRGHRILGRESKDGRVLFKELEKEANPELEAEFDGFLENISKLIFNIQMILDPEIFVIGGGISSSLYFGSRLVEKYEALYSQWARPVMGASPLKILMSEAGGYSNCMGALSYLFSKEGMKDE